MRVAASWRETPRRNGAEAATSPAAAISPRVRSVLRACAGVGVLVLIFHLAHGQLGLGGHALDGFDNDWLYDAVKIAAAVSCLVRARLVPAERLAWLLIGLGLASNAAAEVYYSIAFGDSGSPPVPSVADVLYLLYYPAAYVGLVLLARERFTRFSPSAWLDGAIAATTSAAVIAASLFQPILQGATHGSAAAVATNLAYPVGDLLLLAFVFGMFGLAGWRLGRAWLMLGLGLGLSAIADTAFLYASAHNAYVVGGILDTLWLLSAVITGAAAWQPAAPYRALRFGGLRQLLIPGTMACLAVAVLYYGGFHHVYAIGLTLAAIALLLVIIRAGWIFSENLQLLRLSRAEAWTDALTGLGNRRMLGATLERAVVEGGESPQSVLVVFELDGLRPYRDRFGNLAGDALLAELADRLQRGVAPVGTAYRPGGDELGVLLHCDAAEANEYIDVGLAALSAEGEGFSVGAAYGRVAIPREAHTAAQALRLADDRVYAQKGDRGGSPRQQTHDVLLALLEEYQPDLHDCRRQTGRLAVAVGRTLGLDEEALDSLRRAAELHDLGEVTVPEAVLTNPWPPSERDPELTRRQPLAADRILAAAPALASLRQLVRSSHEHWDGSGYPDGLAGPSIPLGARIVAACVAFDRLTSRSVRAQPMSAHQALAELHRDAGMQFDPEVIETLMIVWQRAHGEALSSSRAATKVAGAQILVSPTVKADVR